MEKGKVYPPLPPTRSIHEPYRRKKLTRTLPQIRQPLNNPHLAYNNTLRRLTSTVASGHPLSRLRAHTCLGVSHANPIFDNKRAVCQR